MTRSDLPKREPLALINPNKAWVTKELDALIGEWHAWEREIAATKDVLYITMGSLYDRGEVSSDSVYNVKKHRLLQEKTLVFLENNVKGHGFINGRDGSRIDRTDLRLKVRVRHRVDDLDELKACLQYAKVPDGYWKTKAREVMGKIAGMAPELAIETVAKYLEGSA